MMMNEDNAAAAFSLPGLRFEPSDAILIGYLYNRVTANTYFGDIIKDCDLYGQKEPWEIWELYGGGNLRPGEDLYFFTQLKKKTANGSRINRSIGTGTWKGEDSGKPITYPPRFSDKPLGYKKRFRYEDGVLEQVGRWIMHEYSLDAWLHKNDDGYVLCRIRKNEKEEKRRK